MIKRTSLLVYMLLLLTTGSVFAANGEPSSWAKDVVNEAIEMGIVPEGIQNNYQQAITREEFASLFVQMIFSYQEIKVVENPKYYGSGPVSKEMFLENVKVLDFNFTDTKSEDVKLAYMMGLVNGTSDTTFSPSKKITRQEAACLLANYSEVFYVDYTDLPKRIGDYSKIASWAKDSMLLSQGLGLLGDTSGKYGLPPYTAKMIISPLGNFTREQAIIVARRAYDLGNFHTVMLRGKIQYGAEATKLKWEVSRNVTTAVEIISDLNNFEDSLYATWEQIAPTMQYKNPTSRQVFSYTWNSKYFVYGSIDDAVLKASVANKNAIFDYGYAEYEIHNPNYVFQFRFKNNGLFTHHGKYGGSKQLPIPYTRLR